ncbi:hydantoinase B/oxoprolinase family protein [Stutzerimonas sp. R40042]|uniref:hydantoinase B/oxoprolinase family protein n=1 Tax=Pseudomonadaceae TaxID=135621 RepID=UPI001F51EAD1|nr:hydantoinase B/oxoprolinase family protein [Stutzerimonas balearica]WAE64084.1 hydantoinase B/oxoprolinase family protein [Stutzerimonas sp. R40042]
MWREGDKAIFDFEGTDPQAPSSVNFYLNEEMFKIFFGALTISLFDPAILLNDGFYDLMGGLLGQGTPQAMNAAGFSDSPHFMYSGYDQQGELFQLFQIGFGGLPGRPVGDGPDGYSLWPGFTNVPNEFVEAYLPLLRIETYETLTDSCGAGLHRGVNGGAPGESSRKELIRADGTRQMLPAKCDNIQVKAGDLVLFDTWGGGGWGDPLQREPAKVLSDIRKGLISVDGVAAMAWWSPTMLWTRARLAPCARSWRPNAARSNCSTAAARRMN